MSTEKALGDRCSASYSCGSFAVRATNVSPWTKKAPAVAVRALGSGRALVMGQAATAGAHSSPLRRFTQQAPS